MATTFTPSKALFLTKTDEVMENPDHSPFVGDFILDGTIFRCRGFDGRIHAVGLPAIEKDAHIEYWQHGQLHRPRAEGPAILSLYGDYAEYWENGVRIA